MLSPGKMLPFFILGACDAIDERLSFQNRAKRQINSY